jgi:hypothetical protein
MRIHPILLAAALAVLPSRVLAWGATGHEVVNRAALASLPADFPAWVREPATAERIAFLANEPDRWRDSRDRALLHATAPDHNFDYEEIADAGMDIAKLPPFRYDFVMQFAAARAAHGANFRPDDPKYNTNHTQGLCGFLPWEIAEQFGELQVAFSYLKTYERYGTPSEIANARANVAYVMGLMGHFVGDGSQPLHVTKYFYGWTGPNPEHFVNRPAWHAWIDSGFINKAGIGSEEVVAHVTPAAPVNLAPRADGQDPLFGAVMDYLGETNRQVVPLYRLERDGPLRMNGPATPEGRAYIDAQLLRAGQMLGSLWLTAWRTAGPDRYLQSDLVKRAAKAHATP